MRNLIRSCMRAPLLLLVGIAAAIPAQAAYDYTAIDFPGAVGASQAFGINNSGQIAGDTLTGIGFVYDIKKNTYTAQPTAPDTTSTTAIGINNPGVTVGGATDPSGVERGAIFDKGSYTLFANPGWFSTEARGISNNGMVTGYWPTEAPAT